MWMWFRVSTWSLVSSFLVPIRSLDWLNFKEFKTYVRDGGDFGSSSLIKKKSSNFLVYYLRQVVLGFQFFHLFCIKLCILRVSTISGRSHGNRAQKLVKSSGIEESRNYAISRIIPSISPGRRLQESDGFPWAKRSRRRRSQSSNIRGLMKGKNLMNSIRVSYLINSKSELIWDMGLWKGLVGGDTQLNPLVYWNEAKLKESMIHAPPLG